MKANPMKTLLVLVLAAVVSAQAAITSTELKPKWPTGVTGQNFRAGSGFGSAALSSTYALVGAPQAAVGAFTACGSVQVFNPSTGAFVRRIQPPAPAAGLNFGSACAISGSLAFIGAPAYGSGGSGKVFVYNLATGTLIRSLSAMTPAAGDEFGKSLALGNNRLAVGAPSGGTGGKVWLFDLKTYADVGNIPVPVLPVGSHFGDACSIEGDFILVTAPSDAGGKGSAFIYSLIPNPGTTPPVFPQHRWITPGGVGDFAGQSAMLHQGEAWLGTSTNKIYRYDIRRNIIRTLTSSINDTNFGLTVSAASGAVVAVGTAAIHVYSCSSTSNTQAYTLFRPASATSAFGLGCAMAGTTLLLTDYLADHGAADTGGAWIYKNLEQPIPLAEVYGSKGDLAPFLSGTTRYASLGEPVVGRNQGIAFIAGLTGTDSGGGTHKGLWETSNGSPFLAAKTSFPYGGVIIGTTIEKPTVNDGTNFLFRASISGATTSTNQGIFRRTAGTTSLDLQKGMDLGPTGLKPASFGQLSQSRADTRYAVGTKLKLSSTGTVVTAGNDSALVWKDLGTATPKHLVREGDAIAPAPLGELAAHHAFYDNDVLFTSAITGVATSQNQGFYRLKAGAPNSITLLAQRGVTDIKNGIGGDFVGYKYTTFLGASVDDSEGGALRATYTGDVVGEALFRFTSTGMNRMLQHPTSSVAGTGKPARLMGFWAAYNQVIALYAIKGTGITPANDQVLVLYQTTTPVDGEDLILMREGDPAPGCHPAKIGTIMRVEVDPYFGHYYVLATLTGAPAGTELVLFRGYSHYDMNLTNEYVYRRPYPVLRKGLRVQGETSPLTSFTLLSANKNSGGGGNGLGTAIREPVGPISTSQIVTKLSFGTTVQRIAKGIP